MTQQVATIADIQSIVKGAKCVTDDAKCYGNSSDAVTAAIVSAALKGIDPEHLRQLLIDRSRAMV